MSLFIFCFISFRVFSHNFVNSDIVITINQSKDDVQELGEKVSEMEGKIDDLTPPPSEGE